MLTVICRLPISPLSSLSLQLISVAFCKHQVTQQLVRHHGSVRPDEQNSVAEYVLNYSKTFSVFCQDQDQEQDFYLETKTKTCLSSRLLETKTLLSRTASLLESGHFAFDQLDCLSTCLLTLLRSS